jgi:addiction module HigA family antidote
MLRMVPLRRFAKEDFPKRNYRDKTESTMTMKTPPHPGLSVRFDCLEPLGLSIAEGAKVLGVTRQALNNLVTGKSGISPEMAVRLRIPTKPDSDSDLKPDGIPI